MTETTSTISPEVYYSENKSQVLLDGSFYHSQGLQSVQEMLAIGLRLMHPHAKIDPQILETIPAKTEHMAHAMQQSGVHGEFYGIDPHREPILRLRDMLGIVNDGKIPQYFYDAAYQFLPERYAPKVTDRLVTIPDREHADWLWYGILFNMVERDSHYICPNDEGIILGRAGDPTKRDIYDSQFCRLILQQNSAYTEEYTEIMREVRKFLQRELPSIREEQPELYEDMIKVVEQYNRLHKDPEHVFPKSNTFEEASLAQLKKPNRE